MLPSRRAPISFLFSFFVPAEHARCAASENSRPRRPFLSTGTAISGAVDHAVGDSPIQEARRALLCDSSVAHRAHADLRNEGLSKVSRGCFFRSTPTAGRLEPGAQPVVPGRRVSCIFPLSPLWGPAVAPRRSADGHAPWGKKNRPTLRPGKKRYFDRTDGQHFSRDGESLSAAQSS